MGGYGRQQMPSSVGGHSRQVQQSGGSFFEGGAMQGPPGGRYQVASAAEGGRGFEQRQFGVIGGHRHGQSFGSATPRRGGGEWHPMFDRGAVPPSCSRPCDRPGVVRRVDHYNSRPY
jgi:hypothetical protein